MARYAEPKLIELLDSNPDIASKIDTYGALSAIFNDTIKPKDFNGDKYIMVYGGGPISLEVPINQPLTISVRTPSRSLCIDIVNDIIDTIHRFSINGFNFVCTPLAVVRPQDETDIYNAPINIRAQSK